MNILVADDDPVHIHLVSSRLRPHGFNVVVARDAMQVLMLAMRSKPAAILLDINMPGGTGVQALKQLKCSVITNPIPVIVVSGNDDPNVRETVQSLGVEEFFPKPFDFDAVLSVLCRVTGKSLDAAKEPRPVLKFSKA